MVEAVSVERQSYYDEHLRRIYEKISLFFADSFSVSNPQNKMNTGCIGLTINTSNNFVKPRNISFLFQLKGLANLFLVVFFVATLIITFS
jgi:hypothetical protein